MLSNLTQEHIQIQPTQVFELEGTASYLIVDNDNGSIEVTGHTSTNQITINAVKIVRKAEASESDFEDLHYEVRRDGNRIMVFARRKRHGLLNLGLWNGRVDISITAPLNLRANLKTDNGSLVLSDFNNSEAAHQLETDNGSLTVCRVNAAALKVESDNGKIVLDNIQARLNAETDNGSITISNANLLAARLESDNGSIIFDGALHLQENGSVKTDNGKITLALARETLPRFQVSTDNGAVHFHLPDTKFEHYSRRRIVTAGNGPFLDVSSNNGSITIS